MSNTFYRKPTIGGDNNAWGPYNDAFILTSMGDYVGCYLYNDAGTLKIAKGRVGINNGTTKGISIVDTITTINLTGTAGIWQKIEMTVSGSAVAFATADIAGETDPAVLPAAFLGAYDPEKMGYYILAAKRCIGSVWVDGSGNLKGVVNVKSGVLGYHGVVYLNAGNTEKLEYDLQIDVLKRRHYLEIGDWNMNVTAAGSASKTVTHNLGTQSRKIISTSVIVRDDVDSNRTPLFQFNDGADPNLIGGGVYQFDPAQFYLEIRTGGYYDNAAWDATSYNRGNIVSELEEQ